LSSIKINKISNRVKHLFEFSQPFFKKYFPNSVIISAGALLGQYFENVI